MKAKGQLILYEVIGRKYPQDCDARLFKMQIHAPDEVCAKSRFVNFQRRLNKFKKSAGEIISLKKISEGCPTRVKNFGVWLQCDSKKGTHNMYKEYRDLNSARAVTSCYREMGARHRVRAHSIKIVRVQELSPKECRRPQIKVYHNSGLRFPLPKRTGQKKVLPEFSYVRPKTHFQ